MKKKKKKKILQKEKCIKGSEKGEEFSIWSLNLGTR